MKLKTANGRLRASAFFKLIITVWAVSWGGLFAVMFCLILAISMLTGEMTINGEAVSGRLTILLQILPFFLLVPIIVGIHAVLFGGLLTLGYWVARKIFKFELEDTAKAQS